MRTHIVPLIHTQGLVLCVVKPTDKQIRVKLDRLEMKRGKESDQTLSSAVGIFDHECEISPG